MRLSKVTIHNFRSIDHLELDTGALTTLLGKNSVGKSNILKALQFFFTFAARGADRADRSSFAGENDPTWVECLFDRLSAAEASEDFDKYRLPDGSMKIRRTLTIDAESVGTELRGYVAAPTEPWLQEEYADYADTERWTKIGVNPLEFAEAGARGGITRQTFNAFREAYIAKHGTELTWDVRLSDNEFRGRQSTAATALPHFIYVPAVGDIVSVIYGKQSALMNQIVAAVVKAARDLPEYVQAQASLEAAKGFVNPSSRRLPRLRLIEEELEARLSSWPGTRVTIRTDVPDIARILVENLVIHIDDGTDADLSQKGDGIQRQVLFHVFRLYADFKGQRGIFIPDEGGSDERRPAIIAFEEPELFLHPQAQDQFYDDLLKVAAADQVLLSTHSVHLVRMDAVEGIHLVRKAGPTAPTRVAGTGADLLSSEDRARLKEVNLLNSDVARVFFADKVLIMEGAEDGIYVLKTAADHAHCLDRRVTVVVTNSKGSIPTVQRVLHGMQIPYVAVYDEDPGNGSSERETRRILDMAKEGVDAGCPADTLGFNPCLPSRCRGGPAPSSDKPYEAHVFMRDQKPTAEFIEQVRALFSV